MFLNNVSVDLIRSITSISLTSLSLMMHKFNRKSIFSNYIKNLSLGGEGKIIEIDESKFEKRKYNREHSVGGIWVFGAVERVTRNILLFPVERRSREVLEEIIFRSIDKNFIVYFDCWKSYRNLGNHFYKHCTVNHSKEFVRYSADGSIHTNTIEENWSAVKRKVLVKCRTSRLIDLHLLRFMLYSNEKCFKLSKLLVNSLFHDYKKDEQ
ncbi:putative transposase-like protein [Vairimorpha ceranae]|uniref:Putative transposase-like protein n=1 Tax=Vairimorpha ceranae TaxID=40302 RepID=A0A0F9W988_9MICR|nr:putative transposase-like protein [Vairimorpha ceranae]KKO73560.1 putative transposase-like protein [Vairimorpha ceranae]